MPEETLSQKTAAFIKERRQVQGLSQWKLAEIVYGSSNMRSHISNIESGKKELTLKTLGHILKALDADIAFIE